MYNGHKKNYHNQGNRQSREKIDFDFIKNGKLNVEWLDNKASDFAQNKIGPQKRGYKEIDQIKYSQIRAFYDEFQTFKAMPFEGEDFYDRVIPLLKLTKAKITNRQNRKVLDKNGYFKSFIINLVDAVKTKEDLENMCLIFEAVTGYFPKTK